MIKNRGKEYIIDEKFLPDYYFLQYCNNCLKDILIYADKHGLPKAIFESKEEIYEYKKAVKMDKTKKYKWFFENGYEDKLYEYAYINLFFSLVSEFTDYYDTSLHNAYIKNINVAWTLLRKPLQEILAYLEWLYIEPEELLKLMIDEGDVKKYEINKNKNKIKEFIKKIKPSDYGEIDVYEFRYSYNQEFTINGILQATNHLITTRPVLKTNESSLNFVFKNEDDINNNTGFYFTSIPYIMHYSMEIIFNIFNSIIDNNKQLNYTNILNLKLKYLCCITNFEKAKELLKLEELFICCPKCGKKYNSYKTWIKFADKNFRCNKCFKKLNTFGYIDNLNIYSNNEE